MNAKEISDATLPAVTPADNDLMLIYDTSEGTTGKATIADIAPKVAENIDISTLPAVTPAADDVLMIRDTSKRTTGKATIADIAPKVAENIDISTLPAVTPAADDVLMIRDTSKRTTGKATIADIFHNIKKVSGTPRTIDLKNKENVYSEWFTLNPVSVPSGAFVLKAVLGHENINLSADFGLTLGIRATGNSNFNFTILCNFGGADVTGLLKCWAEVYYI